MSTCAKWWVYFIPRVIGSDFDPYSATLGIVCTRIAKTRNLEGIVAPKRNIAPNLLSARDSHLSQSSTLSLPVHPAIHDTSSLGPINMPLETNPTWEGKCQSFISDNYAVLTGLSAQLDLLFKTKCTSTFDGTCTLNKSVFSAHGRIRDLDKPVVCCTTPEIA